jgi:hypothetical protein
MEAIEAKQEGYGDWQTSATRNKIVFPEIGILAEKLVQAV